MKRKLLLQMCNDWHANIWMAIELLIVSVVLFVLADKIYTKVATIYEPLGYDAEHCYLLDFTTLTEASPDYVQYPDDEAAAKDLRTLMERLRSRPEIAAAALSHNSYPYNINSSAMQVDIDTFSMAAYPFLLRVIEPDFFKVFKIEGANDESPEELMKILERDKILLSDNALYPKAGIKSLKPFYGKQIVDRSNSDTLVLRSSFKPMRYGDYETVYGFYGTSIFKLLDKYMYTQVGELSVRVHDKMDTDFAEKLMEDADGYLRVGNWYIASVRSFDYIRDNYNIKAKTDTRNVIVCALFLLLNIFLGILGTFWFRTQQRMKEISLRKVCGATKTDIFRRILSEGELLLLLVTPLAIVIDYLLTQYEMTSWYNGYFEAVHFWVSVLVAWGLLAIMTAVGIYFPGRRAMKISPAQALKSE